MVAPLSAVLVHHPARPHASNENLASSPLQYKAALVTREIEASKLKCLWLVCVQQIWHVWQLT